MGELKPPSYWTETLTNDGTGKQQPRTSISRGINVGGTERRVVDPLGPRSTPRMASYSEGSLVEAGLGHDMIYDAAGFMRSSQPGVAALSTAGQSLTECGGANFTLLCTIVYCDIIE